MNDEVWQRLTRLFGLDCLRYLLARETAAPDGSSLPTDLTSQQLEVLGTLARIFSTDIPEGLDRDTVFERRHSVAVHLSMFPENGRLEPRPTGVDGSSRSLAEELRQASGGQREASTTKDPLPRSLFQLLEHAYPMLLLPVAGPGMWPSVGSLHWHPAETAFRDAVMADEVLQKLFYEEREHEGHRGSYIGSLNRGGIQLLAFSSTLILKAWDLTRLDSVTPSFEEVYRKLLVVVAAIRDVVDGRVVDLPVRVGFAGIRLPDDFAGAALSGWRLRSVDRRDGWIIERAEMPGQAASTGPDGVDVLIDYAGNVVLEFTAPYRVKIGHFADNVVPLDLENHFTAMNQAIELVRLGLALAPSSDRGLVAPAWIATFDLLVQGWNVNVFDTRNAYKLKPQRLDAAQAEEWMKWIDLIRGVEERKRIQIALRRFLLALAERKTPEDVLIDSVIVWENLFGANGETSLRVSGSLAWLLGTDAADRRKLRTEFNAIYGLRSKIVHGSADMKPGEIEMSEKALAIAAKALRAIFEHRPDLLLDADSATRSIRLLLGDTD
ncbi:hypothetical protein E1263_20885 [Kribbella antibiotica]|uniref:Uncharacterized protein n=1 Tax=Kribbella antibiotica TaxID=190195 RepID=A0A4R4ZHV2_9ACTN|nr:HEPN domain-containing protein [Kribbella antibiotica]TDD58015.1 hypothetical protein E1263_20885 [Kribbella antibiotica]